MADEPTILFLCPLYIEAQAVKASFDRFRRSITVNGTVFHYGRVGAETAVAVEFDYEDTGPVAAAHYAYEAFGRHPSLAESTSYRFLVGIAGGIRTKRHNVQLGDIVIATSIWDWRSGKLHDGDFIPTKHPQRNVRQLGAILPRINYQRQHFVERVQHEVELMRQRLPEYRSSWERPALGNNSLVIHDGPIASGNIVLKDANTRSLLEQRGCLAVEMEALGVVRKDFIVVRGISDYADSHKNDVWQPYAAANAAACAKMLLNFLTNFGGDRDSGDGSDDEGHGVSSGRRPPPQSTRSRGDKRSSNENSNTDNNDGHIAPARLPPRRPHKLADEPEKEGSTPRNPPRRPHKLATEPKKDGVVPRYPPQNRYKLTDDTEGDNSVAQNPSRNRQKSAGGYVTHRIMSRDDFEIAGHETGMDPWLSEDEWYLTSAATNDVEEYHTRSRPAQSRRPRSVTEFTDQGTDRAPRISFKSRSLRPGDHDLESDDRQGQQREAQASVQSYASRRLRQPIVLRLGR